MDDNMEEHIERVFNGEEVRKNDSEIDDILEKDCIITNVKNTAKIVKIKRVFKKIYNVAKVILKWITILPVVIEYAKKIIEKGD